MNGIEVLILHRLKNKNEDYEFSSAFWRERYYTNPNNVVQKLFEKDYVKLDYDIEINLKQFLNGELKNILRKENLPVSGKKDELIQRIIDYVNINSYQHLLKKSWIPTEKGEDLIKRTDFIPYIHNKNMETIDVLDGYKYYISNPKQASKDIVIGSMRKKLSFRVAVGDVTADLGLPWFYHQLSQVCGDYNDIFGQFKNLINSLVAKFIDKFQTRSLADTWLSDFDRFLREYGLNRKAMEELKMLLSMNEEYTKDIKKIISLFIEDLEELNLTYTSLFSNKEINLIITAWLNENPKEYRSVYREVFLSNGGSFEEKKKIPKAIEKFRDHDVLYSLFLVEPEIIEHGESVLSLEECEECKETGIYIGPEVDFVEIGRCLHCGTFNTES